jgi:hypothetical protein
MAQWRCLCLLGEARFLVGSSGDTLAALPCVAGQNKLALKKGLQVLPIL